MTKWIRTSRSSIKNSLSSLLPYLGLLWFLFDAGLKVDHEIRSKETLQKSAIGAVDMRNNISFVPGNSFKSRDRKSSRRMCDRAWAMHLKTPRPHALKPRLPRTPNSAFQHSSSLSLSSLELNDRQCQSTLNTSPLRNRILNQKC